MKGQFGYQLWFDHTCSGYSYEHVQTRQFHDHCENSNCRDCAEEASCLDTEIGTCICWFVYDSVRRLYCTESSWIRVLYEIVSWFMIYIIYDSGFLALRFPSKTFVLCVIDISLCALWLWSWFNCFRKNNSRSDSIFNKWRKLLDQGIAGIH